MADHMHTHIKENVAMADELVLSQDKINSPCNTTSSTLCCRTEHFFMAICRVHTDIKTLFSRTFQDLQRPNSRVFQDSKMRFQGLSRIHSIHKRLHEVKKCTYQISFRCNCIMVNKPKCNTRGDKMHTMYYNEYFFSREQYLNQNVIFSGPLF